MKGLTMYQFNVPKMSCGGCLNNITKAIHKVDSNAKVEADFPTKTLRVETELSENEVSKVIADAGYPPI
jgi:copper chaperone